MTTTSVRTNAWQELPIIASDLLTSVQLLRQFLIEAVPGDDFDSYAWNGCIKVALK